ncbi:MAG: hypothetical protein HZC28_12815 [Spirochaetes bacterium]|nr:hypothetical protein [Spirochaetota bacterium]
MTQKVQLAPDGIEMVDCKITIPQALKERIELEAVACRRTFEWVVLESLREYFNPKDRRRKKRHPMLR